MSRTKRNLAPVNNFFGKIKVFRQPRTTQAYRAEHAAIDELYEYGYEPSNREKRRANAPEVEAWDDIPIAAIDEVYLGN